MPPEWTKENMRETIENLLPELIRQAPSVVVLIIILLHQQQQINALLEKCIVISQALP